MCTASETELSKAGSNCVSCHMPVSGSEDIPHVTIHDHFIRKPVAERKYEIKGALTGLKSINGKHTDTLTLIKAYLTYFEKFEQHSLYMKKADTLLSHTKSKETNALKIHYYYNLQKFDSVALRAQKLSVEKETDSWTCYMAGRSLQLVKKYETSEKWLRHAVKLTPQNLNYRTALADLYIDRKKYVQAEDEILYVLSQDPKFERVLESKIRLYLAVKDLKEANLAALQCLKLNPDSILALHTLIKISEQTNSGHPGLKYWKHRLSVLENK
jgi:tetratricopeptide (TPR) repeat protein